MHQLSCASSLEITEPHFSLDEIDSDWNKITYKLLESSFSLEKNCILSYFEHANQ